MTEEEFWSIWRNTPQPVPPPVPEYRLYYDENGFPLFYSTENLPGMYIVIDQATYLHNSKHIRIVDGKLIEMQICSTKKIIPSAQGHRCDPWDVCVIVDQDQPHVNWKLKYEEPPHETN